MNKLKIGPHKKHIGFFRPVEEGYEGSHHHRPCKEDYNYDKECIFDKVGRKVGVSQCTTPW